MDTRTEMVGKDHVAKYMTLMDLWQLRRVSCGMDRELCAHWMWWKMASYHETETSIASFSIDRHGSHDFFDMGGSSCWNRHLGKDWMADAIDAKAWSTHHTASTARDREIVDFHVGNVVCSAWQCFYRKKKITDTWTG